MHIKPKFFKQVLGYLSGASSSEIDRELPFAALLFTLLAASGVTIYESWKKLCKIGLLPSFQKEAREIVRQVEVLGYDPLTVMYKRAGKVKSKNYREFLLGYVSSVRSGGNTVNYLKSKLRSIFDVQSAAAVRSIERLGTLVEAYAVMLIVTLCSYILFIVFSTTSIFEPMKTSGTPGMSPVVTSVLVFFVTPMISIVFMAIANAERKSNLTSVKKPFQLALPSAVAVGLFLVLLAFPTPIQFLAGPELFPLVITVCLTIISFPPMFAYAKIARINSDAETAMPSFLRDVTEARKTGLSPEKSIIHAAKRTGYGRFTGLLHLIRSQMEWGVSLRKIFENLGQKIRSWPVLVHFLILSETIKIGGGATTALDILTEYSEKQRDVDANKKSLLRPYVILAFVWSILIALTTTMVAMTVFALTQISMPGTAPMPIRLMQDQINMFSVGIIFQCWLSGFFVGKVNEGTFAAGFKYSVMLVITAYLSLVLSRGLIGDLYGVTVFPQ
ncbi:MAG: type II secretion system F family protein [Candidatus Bathyarchaeota archaeon]|nr:type II secretion system F family protein [Candidatus Bathyarchaeota archaeon]